MYRKLAGLMLAAAAAALISVAPGCASPPAGATTQEQVMAQTRQAVVVGIAAVKGVRTVGDQLLLSKQINATQAQDIQDKCNQARVLLDAARALLKSGTAVDLSTAQGKLNVAQMLLTAASDFLAQHGGTPG